MFLSADVFYVTPTPAMDRACDDEQRSGFFMEIVQGNRETRIFEYPYNSIVTRL
jgi:hypothetical protein